LLGAWARRHGRKTLDRVMAYSTRTSLIIIGVVVAVLVIWLVATYLRRRARRLRGEPVETPLPTHSLRAVPHHER
jgi:hypothetical protein